MYRHKKGLALYDEQWIAAPERGDCEPNRMEVRYAISDSVTVYPPKDGQEGSVFIEGEDEAAKEVPTLCPRNVAFDSEDADERQWATGMRIPVRAFFELYEEVS